MLCTSNIGTAQNKMSPSEAEAFKINVEKKLQERKTVVADFDAVRNISVLKKPVYSSGVFKLKDKKMLWSYNPPRMNAMVFDHNKLYMKDEQGEISTIDLLKNRRFRQLQKLIVARESNQLFDDSQFDIEFLKNGSEIVVVLNPKLKEIARWIQWIELTFDAADYSVTEIKITEQSNDYMHFKLRNKQFNVTISDSEFKL